MLVWAGGVPVAGAVRGIGRHEVGCSGPCYDISPGGDGRKSDGRGEGEVMMAGR